MVFFLCGEFGLAYNYDFKYVCLYMRNSFLFNLFIIQTFMEHRRGSLAECSLQCECLICSLKRGFKVHLDPVIRTQQTVFTLVGIVT